jgi:CRISPR-associated protein Cst2
MKIKSILVSVVAPMSDHAANRGEKLLGNASSIKRRPDGRVYVSGQMQRHVLFSAMERLNADDEQNGSTYVSNGDGVSLDISKDLRSDLGGFLDTNQGDYSGRRTAPLTATPAIALQESEVGRDLLVRLKMDSQAKGEGKKQALATNEYSQTDTMLMNFHLDVGAIGLTKKYQYSDEKHISTEYENHLADASEKMRRVKLFLEATNSMTDYANQARNAVSGEPQKVLIVIDNRHSRKAIRYFASPTKDKERENILKELESRGAKYFLGDDTGELTQTPVYEAYQKAFETLQENELYSPATTV